MDSPQIKKLYQMQAEGDKPGAEGAEDGSGSARRRKTMAEVLLESEKQKKKNLMISAIHQQQRELEQPETKEKQEDQIKQAMQKRDETKKMIDG